MQPSLRTSSPPGLIAGPTAHPRPAHNRTRPGSHEPWPATSPLRSHLLACLAFSLLGLAALLHRADLGIDPWDVGNLPYYIAIPTLAALRFGLPRTRWRHGMAVATLTEYVAIFAFTALICATASYPVAALSQGYADASLQAIDQSLGFDWLAWYRLICASPLLQVAGTAVYRSIYVTPAILLAVFAFTGQQARAWRFLSAFWLAAVLTLTLFSVMPAVGPFSHLWHGPISYMPESELWQSGLIPALRDHAVHVVDLAHLRGIVSAPSFHTAAAILYMTAAWNIRSLRWPIIALNMAMLAATPVEGTHYFTDMILGACVAALSLLLVRLHADRLERLYNSAHPL